MLKNLYENVHDLFIENQGEQIAREDQYEE